VEELERARSAVDALRWDEAYAAFHAAAEVAPLSPEDLESLADAAWWIGRTDESLARSEDAYHQHLAAGRAAHAARLAIEVGFLWLLRGEETVGSGWVRRAARQLADLPEGPEHGYLHYLDAQAALDDGDLERAVEVSRSIQRIAARHDDVTLGAIGLVLEGSAQVKAGHVDEGLALLDEAMLPVRAGRVAPSWAGNLYCHLMSLFFELADLRRARDWTDATERWCDQHSNAAMFAGICRVHRAQLLHLQGAWDDAERQATQVCRDLADMNLAVVAEGRYQIAELRRLRGDLDGAEQAYQQAHDLGREPQPGLALLRLAQGRTAAASTAIRAALATVDASLQRVPLLSAQVEISAATGTPEAASIASQAAAELARVADTYGTAGLIAAARHAAGVAHLVADEADRAIPLLRDARGRWLDLGAPREAAHARARLGEAYAAVGDAEAAERESSAGRQVLEELGAIGDLQAMAGSRAGAAGGLPGGLTRREAEVLACMAAGRSNRQIAATLSISERTVERHLSNIFVKLGVASRTEAAAFAFAQGVADPAAR
jgi:ATP/maltotriose-dependent transcriptional regulator MalT